MTYQIRTFGDPVLASQALPVTDIDAKIVRIVDEMFDTLYDSDSGIGLPNRRRDVRHPLRQ